MLSKLYIGFYIILLNLYVNGFIYNYNHNQLIKLFTDVNKTNRLKASTTSILDNTNILKEAIFNRSISKDIIIQNILELENKVTNNNSYSKLDNLQGNWELIFSSLIPSGYFPVSEICNFFGYTLNSNWGLLSLGGFKGYSKILSDNPVSIEFNSEEYIFPGKLFKIKISNSKIRSYQFLFIGEDYAIARSFPSKGLTLMKKVITKI